MKRYKLIPEELPFFDIVQFFCIKSNALNYKLIKIFFMTRNVRNNSSINSNLIRSDQLFQLVLNYNLN